METDPKEIDEGVGYVGYRQAFGLIAANIHPAGVEEIASDTAVDRVAAADVIAKVSYPTVDVSLKDGFAVKSVDITAASAQHPIRLKVAGSVFAGARFEGEVRPGRTVKVCSGAPIPAGAEAVVSEEFCEELPGNEVDVIADAVPGRNILRAGGEVAASEIIVPEGGRLTPGYLGLAAAAGVNSISVYRRPLVAIIGVGDEVVAPGDNLRPGQLYASNLVTMQAWLASFGVYSITSVVNDNVAAIKKELLRCLPRVDVVLTSGGAWGSERDLVIGSLNELGWRELFHHVRMGPGKGIAFGIFQEKPVFCLPGGPASNEMAFIQLALPGILRIGGDTRHPLPTVSATLTEDVKGRHPAWTEFKDAMLTREAGGGYCVGLYRHRSRLQAIASANSLICVPEGAVSLSSGEIIHVQVLRQRPDDI
jgi:molybdopterin molybdotransferase